MKRKLAVIVLILLALPGAAMGVEPGEALDDPALEARARELSKILRCVVCQNQSIDDSNAGLARDLRLLVRRRLVAGDSDAAVLDYVTARYGDFVLLRPPVKPKTYALWFGPPILVLIGAAAVVLHFRRRRREFPRATPPLSADEKRRIDRLMESGE